MTAGAMAGEIHEGSVPAYYREVYEAIRCRTDERVQAEVFQRLMQRTDLPKAALNQIAEHVDCTDGFLTKLSLYKALALIALAQQGKQPSPKLLENVIQELPKPQLGEPRELNALRMQPAQNDVLTILQTLEKLLAKDTIQVELIPEKKGLFLKHVEYQVTSQRYKVSVYRRYSDFDVFHEVLLQKFAYRVVPALPPKRMLKGVLTSLSEREFIEGRRRALGRFLNLVARHPLFSEDELVKTFLTFSGSDVQTRLRDTCKKTGDEFMTNRIATQSKEYLPADIQAQFSTSRELIKNIHNSFQRLRDRAEKMAERSKENATDLLQFGRELRYFIIKDIKLFILQDLRLLQGDSILSSLDPATFPLQINFFVSALGSDASALPSLASSQSSWGTLRQSLKSLSVEFAVLSDKAAQQGRREEDDVVERLNFFLDLLQSYKDLCERHEKGVLHEHQRALHKYGVMKRQMMSASVQPKEQSSVEQLESRIVQQESAIQTMELRNYFSLFCLHQETQLIFSYLPITSHILGAFVNSQVKGHREMGEVWNELQPKLGGLFGSNNGLKPST